ncbi:MAG TPA: DUF2231 domain-containing protein [Acidobacteriaceae bacterium]|jgi:uncharacterized membrane protein|nr:DUF2231 domain-containing protein [Acidobacteriaceae bacterium]
MSTHLPVSTDPVAAAAERQNWIHPGATAAQQAIQSAFKDSGPGGEKLLSFLHGDWLHEPLHAVLTDVPIGAWTVTILCDAVGAFQHDDQAMNTVADASLAIGLAGAVGAAVTGLADWSEVREEAPRRIGAVHALLNIGATALFMASMVARRRDTSRSRVRALAALGYAVASLSAHLGGNLVYEHGVGVRDRPQPQLP